VPEKTVLLVSITEILDFLRCRRSWDFSSPNRQGLVPRGIPQIALHIGSAVHHGVAAPIFGDDPQEALEAWFHKERTRVAREYALMVGTGMSPSEIAVLDESKSLATSMVEHYFETYGPNPIAPFRYLFAELPFRIPVKELWRDDLEVWLVGTIDGVAEDDYGNIYEVERKTAGQKPDTKWLKTDHQLAGYAFALQVLTNQPVAGVLYDGLIKRLPKMPRTLQNGLLSQEWIDTTATAYLRALVAHHGEDWRDQEVQLAQGRLPTPLPTVYDDFLGRLRDRDKVLDTWDYNTPFFVRKRVSISQTTLTQWWHDTFAILTDIVNDPAIYPHFSWMGCYDCWVQDLCLAKQLGGDFEQVRDTNYTYGGHRPQYRTMLEITPESVQSVDDLRRLRAQNSTEGTLVNPGTLSYN
jgi:PD-(D/E)XK nuclease superfamily